MKKTDNGRENFFKDFGARFNETVLNIEMANIMASGEVFKILNLVPQNNENVLWGLLVFCESKKVYFYVPASESVMSAMVRVTGQGEEPKEQVVCLSDIEGFKIPEKKKRWFDFFIPGTKFRLDAEFAIGGKKFVFEINTQNKACKIQHQFL
ncbi:MAG: hypothetical protein ACI4LX_02800 [Treponema sp.]